MMRSSRHACRPSALSAVGHIPPGGCLTANPPKYWANSSRTETGRAGLLAPLCRRVDVASVHPIRHHDHATPNRAGGTTSALNGLGTCAACNYAKEASGWRVSTSDADGQHTAEYLTPTGATYYSIAPPLPGTPLTRRKLSLVEGQLSIDLVTFDKPDAA